MASLAIRVDEAFETITCYCCGVVFAVTKTQYDYYLRVREQATFYCTNGHSQCFVGKTDVQKAKEETQAERVRHQETLARLNKSIAEANALKKQARRLKAGVCPCCKRNFVALGRHMRNKHPDYPTK